MTSEAHAGRSARRRGEELDEAIREAVREELTARGFADLTFEGVARRARTSKPVVYRRYASRSQMVLDAWVGNGPSDPMPESSGSLREDLRILGGMFSQRLERIGVDTIRGLIAEVRPEQIQELTEVTTSWARVALTAVLDAARDRGELRSEPIPEYVLSLPIVLVRNEVLLHGASEGANVLDDGVLDRIIDDVCLPLFTGRLVS